ncbi:MAG TPA: hypothetical protein VMV70_09290 [Gallionella sp.]|nr:hypothetical protein [Gallionella sp.]
MNADTKETPKKPIYWEAIEKDWRAGINADKECPKCHHTGVEFGPNKARKNGLQVYCRSCMTALRIEKQYDKARWATCREEESKRNREYRIANAEVLKPKDREKAINRRLMQPAVIRMHNITRKHRQLQATPPWADMETMNAIYAEAKRLQQLDGIERHVDHDIPLKHPLVCGLHVQFNLQILTAHANMSKHNQFEVSM